MQQLTLSALPEAGAALAYEGRMTYPAVLRAVVLLARALRRMLVDAINQSAAARPASNHMPAWRCSDGGGGGEHTEATAIIEDGDR